MSYVNDMHILNIIEELHGNVRITSDVRVMSVVSVVRGIFYYER